MQDVSPAVSELFVFIVSLYNRLFYGRIILNNVQYHNREYSSGTVLITLFISHIATIIWHHDYA